MVVGEFTQETDLVVIGGGPAGYAASFRAAELGVSTVLVDPRESLGGVCLHEGCIPSKTLLHVVETIRSASRSHTFGVAFEPPTIDLGGLRDWIGSTVDKLSKGLAGRAKKLDVEHLRGTAMFDDSRSLTITGDAVMHVRFRRALIATGSRPIEHPKFTWDGTRVLKPQQAVRIPTIPSRLLIIGHGYMMVELACIYAALGSEVTLVSETDSHLPGADEDLIRSMMRSTKDSISGLHTGVTIDAASVDESGVLVRFSGPGAPDTATFDQVVVSRGQRPNIDGLRLDRTDVRTSDEGGIIIDEQCRSTDPRVFAGGDVTGGSYSANVALHQGRIAAEAIAGWDSAYDAQVCPMTVFTDPNIAWCGLTESQAKEEGREVSIAKLPWSASGRITGMGRQDGLTKLIFDAPTGLVLGVGLVGPNAAEMIAEAALGIEMGATLTDLALTLHPHPSASELLSDAAQSQITDDA